MKYALKLARHGSIFLARVVWIGAALALDFFMMLISSSGKQNYESHDIHGDDRPGPWNMTRTERYQYDPDGYQDYRHHFYDGDN